MTYFILVANRGKIAIQMMGAADELDQKTVVICAEEDKLSLLRFKADEAYKIGEGMEPIAAHMSMPEIIRVAKMAGADAIHPGYGLPSEHPDFVDACAENCITFIGSKAKTMRQLGDKTSARKVAVEAGVPVIPAPEVLDNELDAIRKEAAEIGFSLMLKASWGGGGRGMHPINNADELEEKVKEGRREAETALGNGECYLHEMPGGQFTNLKAQARSMGLEERWHEVAQVYADVNMMFGDIVKVTPHPMSLATWP